MLSSPEGKDLYFIFDTETSGMRDFKASYAAPQQPNLLQLGYQVVTEDNELVFEKDTLVNTTGFKDWNGIHPEAQAIHGIDEARVRAEGADPKLVMLEFLDWYARSKFSVAHNHAFDSPIMQTFAYRAGFSPDIFVNQEVCTMKLTTPILKIRGARGVKWPKLSEAYGALVDENGFENAHDALSDVKACRAVLFALFDKGLVQRAPEMPHVR